MLLKLSFVGSPYSSHKIIARNDLRRLTESCIHCRLWCHVHGVRLGNYRGRIRPVYSCPATKNISRCIHFESHIIAIKCFRFEEIFVTAPEVVNMTTSSATSDENFIKMTTFRFNDEEILNNRNVTNPYTPMT